MQRLERLNPATVQIWTLYGFQSGLFLWSNLALQSGDIFPFREMDFLACRSATSLRLQEESGLREIHFEKEKAGEEIVKLDIEEERNRHLRSVPKDRDVQRTLSGIVSRSTDSKLAMESCMGTTGTSN
jgi:hypothetical protein